MQFKIDENLPSELATLLVDAGYDALTVYDQKLEGKPDEIVSTVCKTENRVLVTLDVGFANINIYLPENYPGIIVLRVKSQDKLTLTSTFFKVIPLLESEPLTGKLWIVDENKVRIRE